MSDLRLVQPGEAAPRPVSGEQVLAEIRDLIVDRLPRVDRDDPQRGVLEALACVARSGPSVKAGA